MRNLKHTTAAAAAVVMIGSLAFSQAEELRKSYNITALLAPGTSDVIVYENHGDDGDNSEHSKSIVVISDEEAQNEFNEQYTQEELDSMIAAKSRSQEGYVILSSGILSVREAPSAEAEIIDALVTNSTVEILESTEDWYRIRYGENGSTGYASKSFITVDKAEAELAAKYYDNYRYGTINTDSGSIRIRKGPSTSTEILGELENGSTVLICGTEDGFTKVCYGEDYSDGYIISSAIENTDSWLPKAQLETKKQEAAAKKQKEQEEKERKEREAQEKKAAEQKTKEQKTAKAKSSSAVSSTVTTGAASSSKGQAIVNTAKQYLGVRYVYGGTSPSGFDCSGFVKYVLSKNGISVSRTSASQAREGKAVSFSEMQPGDLIFFAKSGRVHHVGIYVGNGQMIHAPQTGDVVRYASVNTAYRQREFYCARRFY